MSQLKNLLYTLLFLTAAMAASQLLFKPTESFTISAVFFTLAVFLTSRFTTGYIWGILSSIAGIVIVNYFFTYPYLQIDFLRIGYPITFVSMLIVSLITSMTTIRLNIKNQEMLNQKLLLEKLNEFNNHLLLAKNSEEMLKLSISFLSELNHAKVSFVPNNTYKNHFLNMSFTTKEDQKYFNSNTILEFIQRTIKENKIQTFTKEEQHYLFLPVSSAEHIWGALILYSPSPICEMELNQLIIPQLSLAFEHYYLIEHHQKLMIESEKEKMRSNLLRAVSHDLRTPLTSIIGSSSTYLEAKDYLNDANKTKLIAGILEDANWLIHMVENLLSVTKINQDTALVKKSLESVEEVVSEAMIRFQKRYPNSQVEVNVPKELLMVPMDGTLIEQVIINLLENAVKYSNSQKPIRLSVEKKSEQEAYFSVKDFGTGLSSDHLSAIFDGTPLLKEAKNDRNKGMGIGLSICKSIILAHQGKINAANHEEGAVFSFSLPL